MHDFMNTDFDPYQMLQQLARNQEDLYNRQFQTARQIIELQRQVIEQEHQLHRVCRLVEQIVHDINQRD